MAPRAEHLVGGGDADKLFLSLALLSTVVVRMVEFRFGDICGFDLLLIGLVCDAQDLVVILD